jgi:hypothetical protein
MAAYRIGREQYGIKELLLAAQLGNLVPERIGEPSE